MTITMPEEQIDPSWVPPGTDGSIDDSLFADEFPPHFFVAPRLRDKSVQLIETANGYHYAMLNDKPRNEFYYKALQKVIKPDSLVLEIGTGSGLLAMMAARLGAKHVTTIEANKHLVAISRHHFAVNGLSDKITVLNRLSTDVQLDDLPYGRCNVLVSEILGTLLLGENALEFVEDARRRLLTADAKVIPAKGVQCVRLIECPALHAITAVSDWNGFQLNSFNSLRDTASVVNTKAFGFRLSSVPYKYLSPRLPILEVDFTNNRQHIPASKTFHFRALESGTVHAALYSWEAFSSHDADAEVM